MLLCLVLLLSLAVPVSATGGSLTINGKSSFTCKPGISTATDLFDEGFKNVMPGDTIEEIITISSGFPFHEDTIKVYMKAVPHSTTNLPETGVELEKMNTFLSQLTLKVTNLSDNNKVIFDGAANTQGGLSSNVLLGTFRKNGKIQLKVQLNVPITLSDTFAYQTGEVDWLFTIEAFDDPDYIPKTGDYIGLPLAVMAGSGTGLAALLALKKRRHKA